MIPKNFRDNLHKNSNEFVEGLSLFFELIVNDDAHAISNPVYKKIFLFPELSTHLHVICKYIKNRDKQVTQANLETVFSLQQYIPDLSRCISAIRTLVATQEEQPTYKEVFNFAKYTAGIKINLCYYKSICF